MDNKYTIQRRARNIEAIQYLGPDTEMAILGFIQAQYGSKDLYQVQSRPTVYPTSRNGIAVDIAMHATDAEWVHLRTIVIHYDDYLAVIDGAICVIPDRVFENIYRPIPEVTS